MHPCLLNSLWRRGGTAAESEHRSDWRFRSCVCFHISWDLPPISPHFFCFYRDLPALSHPTLILLPPTKGRGIKERPLAKTKKRKVEEEKKSVFCSVLLKERGGPLPSDPAGAKVSLFMMDWRRPPPDPSPDLPPSDSSSLLSRWLDLLSQVGTEAKESLIVDGGGGGRATPSGRSSGASRRARNRGDRESPFLLPFQNGPLPPLLFPNSLQHFVCRWNYDLGNQPLRMMHTQS